MNAFDKLSRFSATPKEIHDALREVLCEDTYLKYLRWVETQVLDAMVADEMYQGALRKAFGDSAANAPVPHAYGWYLTEVPHRPDPRTCTVPWHTHADIDSVILSTCQFPEKS